VRGWIGSSIQHASLLISSSKQTGQIRLIIQQVHWLVDKSRLLFVCPSLLLMMISLARSDDGPPCLR
jgi:hypothetical protein